MTRLSICLGTLAIGAVLSGCAGDSGPNLYAVKGRVVSGGQPVTNVSVTFSPEDSTKPSSAGVVNSNGEFTLSTVSGKPGAVAGNHKVTLGVMASTGVVDEAAREEMMRMRSSGQAPGRPGSVSSPTPQQAAPPFPKEYTAGDTTPLQFEVSSDESKNDFTIEIPQG